MTDPMPTTSGSMLGRTLEGSAVAGLAAGFAGQLICSGLVARALERTSVIFEEEPSHVTPAGLAKLFGVRPPDPAMPKGRPARRV